MEGAEGAIVPKAEQSTTTVTSDMAPDPRVLVAILTFGRAQMLPRLLRSALAQSSQLQPRADIIVVDNDPRATARETVAAEFGESVRYVLHGAKGIAEGRNRILDEAADYDCVVLIDDDEVPDEHWLRHLVDAYLTHGSAAVAGPQFRDYETAPDPRVAAARESFDRPVYDSGTRMPAAATNNLLLDVAVIRRLGLRFDPRFSVTGGSDTMFTRQLVRAGQEIVWCQEAVATEWVPSGRLTMEWVWKRSMRSGMTWSRTGVALQTNAFHRLATRCSGLARGTARFAAGTLRAGIGHLRRDNATIGAGLRTQARGVGMVAGSLGVQYYEYRNVQKPTAV